jgi:hypothetical protein
MPTKYADLFAELARPFPPDQIKTRPGGQGRQLSYITARTVMNRLDSILGPENWKDQYVETKDGIKCILWVRLPDGEWLPKEDGGGFAGMTEEDNNEKSGFSDAFKRAAVKFGVGRHLYRDGVPDFVPHDPSFHDSPRSSTMTTQRTLRPPSSDDMSQAETPRRNFSPNGQTGGVGGNAPRSGKALFAWSKKIQEEFDVNMVEWINGWAKTQDLPPRMVDWSEPEVARGYQAACQELQSQGFSVSGNSVSSPSRSEPEPSAPPRRQEGTTAVAQDRHHEVVALRKRLIQAIHAKATKDHPNTDRNDAFWAVLDELGQIVELPSGRGPIEDINAPDGEGHNPDTLNAYLTALGTY